MGKNNDSNRMTTANKSDAKCENAKSDENYKHDEKEKNNNNDKNDEVNGKHVEQRLSREWRQTIS